MVLTYGKCYCSLKPFRNFNLTKETKMKLFEIKNRFNGKIIFSIEQKSLKLSVEVIINSGADLRNADLRNADLHGADLRNADLRNADLHGANLRNADLHGANLHGANLRNADLHGANLHGANLRNADLHGANLHGADLRNADLRNADLRNADLHGANLHFSSGTPLHCGGLKIKKDRKQIIQDIYHTASNMKHFLSENKDKDLQKIFEIAKKLQSEFHRFNEVGAL